MHKRTIPSREELLTALKMYWGYDAFRPAQEEIIAAVLRGEDAIALLPTGGGKSLCYQLPAIVQPGCALVISPLIALMEDQVSALVQKGIPAIALHGSLAPSALANAMQGIRDEAYKIIYCSPERVQTRAFEDLLPFMRLSLIAVDEAHCVSQWGHDFRPEYAAISWLGKRYSSTPVLALTATATPRTLADIHAGLALKTDLIFRKSFARAAIFYEVRKTEHKPSVVLEALRACGGSAIVYCRSRSGTEEVRKALSDAGVSAVHYHAGMSAEARTAAQDAWMAGTVQTIAATTAFGMGIDKPDVRLVVHYEPPGDLESWYQETGRAGRDGKPSRALMLYNEGDLRKLRGSTKIKYPPADFLRQAYQAVVEYLCIPISAQPDRYYPFDLADFCKKFSLRATAVAPAMKLLAQEGLWTLSDASLRPPPARFTTSRQRLDDFIARYPEPGFLATSLLRLYAGIFTHPVPVHLSQVARKMKCGEGAVADGMKALAQMGIIAWEPRPDGPRIFFSHYRVESKNLVLNTDRLKMLRARHETATETMVAFAEDDTACRGKTALAYFGEASEGNCGHCDVCARKAEGIPDGRSIRTIIADALTAAGAPLPLSVLSSLAPPAAEGSRSCYVARHGRRRRDWLAH